MIIHSLLHTRINMEHTVLNFHSTARRNKCGVLTHISVIEFCTKEFRFHLYVCLAIRNYKKVQELWFKTSKSLFGMLQKSA